MASLHPPVCDFGWRAPDFNLPDTTGKMHTRDSLMGKNGLLVMFICNHCPYVKSILPRLLQDVRELQTLGVNAVAIMSNDTTHYPEDGLENMQKIAQEMAFSFPYLLDATQEIAKNYGAVCTPDFFGFNHNFALQYRGRFDAAGRSPEPPLDNPRDLLHAMKMIAETGQGPQKQVASIGCSIKWKNEG